MTEPNTSPQRSTTVNIILIFLLLIHAQLLAWTAAADSPTTDEPFHLAGGIRRIQKLRFDVDRGSPPLAGATAAIPVVLLHPKTDWSKVPGSFNVGDDFVRANGSKVFWYFTVGRWACIPFSLLGCWICFRWSRELYGDIAGLLAAALWCFSPNIIAHGHLLTADMSTTAFGAFAVYSFWKWLRNPTLARAIVAGVVLGIAELTKFVLLILYPVTFALWLLWRTTENPERDRPSTLRQLGLLILIYFVSIDVINMGYLGGGTFQRLDHYQIGRKLLRIDSTETAEQPHGIQALFGRLPVPLPEDYILGIDEIDNYYGHTDKLSYLRGELKQGTWWYYYLYALLVKTPVGTIALFGLACLLSWNRFSPPNGIWQDSVALIFPAVSIIAFVSWYTVVNAHLRYVLPAVPFLMVWTSQVAQQQYLTSKLLKLAVGGCLTATIVSSLIVYPHSLSYFNLIVGGPKHGHEHLIDSNIDWSQDLFYLNQWLQDHPEARPLYLEFETFGDQAKALGIDYPTIPPEPLPGWYAIRVHHLYLRSQYKYLQQFEPVDRVAYSVFIFHVDCKEANDLRSKLRLPPLSCNDNNSE